MRVASRRLPQALRPSRRTPNLRVTWAAREGRGGACTVSRPAARRRHDSRWPCMSRQNVFYSHPLRTHWSVHASSRGGLMTAMSSRQSSTRSARCMRCVSACAAATSLWWMIRPLCGGGTPRRWRRSISGGREAGAGGGRQQQGALDARDPAASASASAAKTAAESQRGRGMSSRPANVVVRHLSLLGGRSAQNLQRGELLAGRIELLNKGLRNPPSTIPSDRVGFAAPPHRAAPVAPVAPSHRVAPSAHSGSGSVLLHRPPPSAVISSAAATQRPRSVAGVTTLAASTGAPQPPPPRLRASRSAPSIAAAITALPLRKAGVTAGERAMAFY